jgi:Cu2+-exporting ATPase
LSRGLTNAIALLVVTCPCGLGLATPLVMTMAMGRSARLGILAKNSEAIEALGTRQSGATPRVLLVDKTGTLTEGKPSVTGWTLAADAGVSLEVVQRLAIALESGSQHHVARAICMVPRSSGAGVAPAPLNDPGELPQASDVREVLGAGREGIIEGRHVRIGTRAFVSTCAGGPTASIPKDLAAAERDALERADSPVFIAIDGRVVALVGIGDRIRHDAPEVLASLRARGWHVRVASGDASQVVRHVGAALGIADADCLGGLTPEGKLALVRESRDRATTVMLGDGVNDAPALAAASVGIAVQGGAEASLAATDIYLTKPGLSHVLTLLDGADRTMRAIRWCVFASIAYNIVAAALSITGIINPLLAAIIMPMASLTVLVLALRMPTFRAGDRAASVRAAQGLRSRARTPVPPDLRSPLSEAIP